VNDGRPEVAEYLAARQWPEFIEILNLPENRRFAGANNAGWRQLIERHPEIRFLGTINDDTVPRKGWLDAMAEALERYPRAALAMPVMGTNLGPLHTKKNFATWEFRDGAGVVMAPRSNNIRTDEFVSAVNGYCFLAARTALEEAGFFDEGFRNSCEDLDLGISLLRAGLRMVTCHRAWVFHYGKMSRKIKGADTNVTASRELLLRKWGAELSKYNALDGEGFLKELPPLPEGN